MAEGKRKINPNSLKNLKTGEDAKEYNRRLTAEEFREKQSRAGKASAQKKKDKRTLKEIVLALMEEEASKEDVERLNLPEGVSKGLVMTAALLKKAMEGDNKSYEVLRDTAGQMPTKEVQVSAEVFTEANKALLDKVAERIKKESE